MSIHRFSALAKEGVDAYLKFFKGYEPTKSRMEEVLLQLTDPFEIGVVRVFKLHNSLIHSKEEELVWELHLIEQLVDETEDEFLEYLYLVDACMYYSGW